MQPPIQWVSVTLKARGKQRDRVGNQQCLVSSNIKKDSDSTSRRRPTIITSYNVSPLALNQPPIKTAAKNDVKYFIAIAD